MIGSNHTRARATRGRTGARGWKGRRPTGSAAPRTPPLGRATATSSPPCTPARGTSAPPQRGRTSGRCSSGGPPPRAAPAWTLGAHV
eukprot:8894820-Pyramimonas_sp.AAC.1